MGIDVPSSLTTASVFKIIVPGLVFIICLWSIRVPESLLDLAGIDLAKLNLLDFIAILILFSVLFGIALSLLDHQIYVFYEGRKCWPHWISGIMKRRLTNRINALECRLRGPEPREALSDLQYFPHRLKDSDGKKVREWYVMYPTRLGNILASWEEYPWEKYGIDVVFYWHRMLFLLDETQQKLIDDFDSKLSTFIYTSTSLLLFALVYLASVAIFSESSYFFQTKLIGLSTWLLEFRPLLELVVSLAFVGVAYLVYRASLELAFRLSSTSAGMFDIFASALDERIQTPTELLELVGRNYFQYLPLKDRRKWIYRFYHRAELPSESDIESMHETASKVKQKILGDARLEDLPLIGRPEAEKLVESGIDTLQKLASTDPKVVAKITGIPDSSSRIMIETLSRLIPRNRDTHGSVKEEA